MNNIERKLSKTFLGNTIIKVFFGSTEKRIASNLILMVLSIIMGAVILYVGPIILSKMKEGSLLRFYTLIGFIFLYLGLIKVYWDYLKRNSRLVYKQLREVK